MYYRIQFKAVPEEFFFELLQEKNVRVQDVIQITKDNFKIKHSNLILLAPEDLRKLDVKEYIDNGRTYIVKRIPMIENKKRCEVRILKRRWIMR